jgi:3-dehydroquinate dehydratase/shikimate dehydrogenase
MTLLIASIVVENFAELRVRAELAWARGADAVELRIDEYGGDPAQIAGYLKANADHTWIITCRKAEEGGHFRGSTAERLSKLVGVTRGTDAYIDFELADWQLSDDVRRHVRRVCGRTGGAGHRLILSAHDFSGTPPGVSDTINDMLGAPDGTVGKVVYKPGHISDTFAALDLMHEHRGTVTAIALGEDGLWTRILAKKLGAFGSYCALDELSATAPGQVSIEELIERYRWPQIDRSTKVFGVIGDPVAHSMSPLLSNRWFAQVGINAVYLPLRVGREGDGLRRFLDGCARRPWLNIGGFSVTIPHKVGALQWVGNGADQTSLRVGAVNTLSLSDRRMQGHNTDCLAAVCSMADALGCLPVELSGLTVDVLGTGGAARAGVYGLAVFGCRVTIYGRSPEKTRRLAEEFDAQTAPWEDRGRRSGHVLINCTSLGMWPEVHASPMPPEGFAGCRLVFDLIYNPLQTRLLRDATDTGCVTLNGLDTFVRQAAAQFELWTRRSPDAKDAAELVAREVGKRAGLPA